MQFKDVRPESFTKEIRCDRCGRLAAIGDPEFEEMYCIESKAGYASVFGDGNNVQVDLCQYCLQFTLGPWLRVDEPGKAQKLFVEWLRRFDPTNHGDEFPTGADRSLRVPQDLPSQEREALDAGKAELLYEMCQLLGQSGEVASLADLAAWLDAWLKEPSPDLEGATPAQALLTASGRRQVTTLLERMRGGLPG